MPTASTKKEKIDERILRILGLNPEEVEMDYITYHNALRESLVRGAKSGLPQEELALIANERSRIRNKKGRFQVKTKKVKINNNNLNSPIKEKRKMLPGATKKEGPSQTKGGALVKNDSSTTDIVNTQGKLLSNLVKTLNFNLKEERKLQQEEKTLIAKKEDKEEKQKKEDSIEKKEGPSPLMKAADKILAPVKSLFERIFDYLKLTALNFVIGSAYKWFTDPANKEKVDKVKNFFSSIGEWFNDPKNQERLSTLGRFLKDNWKVFFGVGGVLLLWSNSIVRLAVKLGATVIRSIPKLAKLITKLAIATAKLGFKAAKGLVNLAIKNPIAAAGTLIVGGTALGLASQAKTQSNDPAAEEGRTQLDDTLDFGGITGSPMGGLFNQGGMVPVMLTKGEYVVPPNQAQKIGAPTLHAINNAENYNQGGLIPGRGPNVDTVRTQLREGSFVIQRPAVDALGSNNIHKFVSNYNEGGNVNKFVSNYNYYNEGGDIHKFVSNYNEGGNVNKFVSNYNYYNEGGDIHKFLARYNEGGNVNKFISNYNEGGDIHKFLARYNKGGSVNRFRSKRSGRAGGKTNVTKTDGGSAIVAAAKNAVTTGRKGPASPPCASWVRMVLGMANHPAANQTTSTADLDPQIGPSSPYATSLASAASFAGSDLGTVIRNSGSLKPGDVILHKNTYGNFGPGAITHVSVASDKKGKILHQSTSGGPPTETNMFSFAHGLRLGGEGTIGEYSDTDPGSTPGKTNQGGFALGGGLGELLRELNLDSNSSPIGSTVTNTKMSQVASTTPTDMEEDEEQSSASVKELPQSEETVDKRSGPQDRMTETMVRSGPTSIVLYDWKYEKLYSIERA